MIRLAVVDDHHFVRIGIQHWFTGESEIEIAGCFAHPAELEHAEPWDVLLCDLCLSGRELALQAISRWSPLRPVLVMSYSGRPSDVVAAVRAGARGYLTKDTSPSAFASAIRDVYIGRFSWSPGLADIVRRSLADPSGRSDFTKLSSREREVLGYLARGLTHQMIAHRLDVAQSTVDTYVKRIRLKLQLGNKAELTRAALEHGLLDQHGCG